MLNTICGFRIIESQYLYEIKSHRGVADKRRPNTRRPLYRHWAEKIPTMHKIGNTIVAHPILADRLRRQMLAKASVEMQETSAALGNTSAQVQSAVFSIDALAEVYARFKKSMQP